MQKDIVVRITKFLPRLLRAFSRSFSNPLTKGAVTVPQLVLLELLYETHMLTMTACSRAMGITTSAVTGLADRLIKAKFVSRLRDEKDRRIVFLSLTSKGKDIVRKLHHQREKTLRKAFRNLTMSERENYLRLVEKIYAGLVKE